MSDTTALAKYDPKRFNVLTPMMLRTDQGIISPVLIETVSVVQINPAKQAGECYHDFRFAPEKEGIAALTALGLAKIAAAAGIQWDPEQCRVLARHRSADGHVYVAYQAAGRVRQPDGQYHVEIASADMDTADEAEQLEDTYQRKLRAGRAKYTEDAIPDMVRRDVMQLREFALRHVETKAKNRVIRRLLSLRQTYPMTELQRPFVVPRLLYHPPPETAVEEGRRAAEQLFGALPSPPSAGQAPERSAPDAVADGAPSELQGSPASAKGQAPSATPERRAAGSTVQATPKSHRKSEETSSQRESEDEVPAAGVPPDAPAEDPLVEDGLHSGKRWSEVAEFHPDYMRAIASEARSKKRRDLAQEWVDFYHPRLGGGA